MSTLLFFAIAVVLAAITVEDFRSRSVHAFWLPVLFLLGFVYAVQFINSKQILEQMLISLIFIFIQGLLLIGYFVWKHKRWIDITELYLGWGDILFIIAVLPFFNSFMFVLFYLSSLLLTILFVMTYRATGREMMFIPLAGIQSLWLMGIVFYHQFIEAVLFNELYSSLIL